VGGKAEAGDVTRGPVQGGAVLAGHRVPELQSAGNLVLRPPQLFVQESGRRQAGGQRSAVGTEGEGTDRVIPLVGVELKQGGTPANTSRRQLPDDQFPVIAAGGQTA